MTETAEPAGVTTETVSLEPPPSGSSSPVQPSWWSVYAESLADSSISGTSCQVIETDSAYIVERGILGAGPPGEGWPEGRVRRGLVMGAVQSGKTASMLGTMSLAIDAGIDMVIVLAGTRTALWHQTYRRLVGQLGLRSIDAGQRRHVLLPQPSVVADPTARPTALYQLNGAKARRSVRQGSPIIGVVMKNIHHIRAVSDLIRDSLLPVVDELDRSFHLLVLDDEADDGSILDARIEHGSDPATDDLKQIPRVIVDLWEQRPHNGTTASQNLYATYIGYTATPQANFLQSDHNPLAPKDFAIALRTPFDVGNLEPRSTTYTEPQGLGSFYTGGETYYVKAQRAKTVAPNPNGRDEEIADAIRAYLVASSIRRWRNQHRLDLPAASITVFQSADEAVAVSPQPMSMLFHPSPAVADQFAGAAEVLAWAAGVGHESATARIQSGERALPVDELCSNIEADPAEWIAWIHRYAETANAIGAAFGLSEVPKVPAESAWPEIATILREDVIPGTKLAIVNSDPDADDRPRFEPQQREDGSWRSAPDLSTIFVSGNVMSRGLTLEGLSTTLFLRRAHEPLADTQMQMQRWFGYRGGYLELCRIFIDEAQRDLFRAYHETDEALRREVVREMNALPDSAPSPKVLQGSAFAATGKLTSIRNVPLCPGPSPFVRLVNLGDEPDPNAELLADIFAAPSSEVVANGSVRGQVLDETCSLVDVAEMLEKLRYAQYSPADDGWESERWRSVEAHIGAEDEDPIVPLYRPPAPSMTPDIKPRTDCPYAIASYLRLWDACLTRKARGLYPTDDSNLPWSMVDLAEKAALQPRFYVGIRFGSGEAITEGPLAGLSFDIKPMQRKVDGGQLEATWGSRNPGEGADAYAGDMFFDYHVHDRTPPRSFSGEPVWRPVGSPGLILFHVIAQPPAPHPVVTVGLGIPLGGPDQFAAWNPS